LNRICQFLVCADDVKILDENKATIKQNIELLMANREVGTEEKKNLSVWLCLTTKMQDKIILIANNPLKMWQSSNIWE
jgi:hypothetical protein